MQRMTWWSMVVIALGACAEGVGGGDGAAGYQLEVRGGALHADPIAGAVALETVLSAASLAPVLGPLGAEDFAANAVHERSPTGREVTVLHAEQTVGGVPIAGAYLHVMVDEQRLLGSSYHLFHGAEVDTEPVIDGEAAEARARESLRLPADAAVRARRLAVHELDGELALVWEISLHDHGRRALVRATGELAGRVEPLDDRVFDGDTRGTVKAWIARGAPAAGGTAELVALAETRVWAGDAATLTTSAGAYTLRTEAGATVAAALVGTAAEVTNRAGTAAVATAPASARVDLSIGTSGAGEQVLAQTTAFHAVTAARRFLIENGIDAAALGAPLAVRVNVPDTCNAYYAPSERRLSLFRSGGGCNNSAEASIVIHEYGHFVDDVFGGIDDDGLSEGWGDTLACYLRGDPIVGGNLFRDGSDLRTCDNDYQYPLSGRDEVHDLGQAWAGFTWHLREGLIGSLGATRGEALARALVFPSLASGAPDIPTAVREVFLRDDDDGDLTNGTPHIQVLRAAAERHGLERVVLFDEAPPAAVEDLRITAATATSVTVSWSAPGDDGRRGTAARYDLRWSAQPITASGFARATVAAAPAPARAGIRQETTLQVAPVARVYVALRTTDELGNVSKLSNVASAALPAPHAIFEDGAESGLGGWAATGLWHVTRRDAGSGRQSFWYGREATGTYETGARTSGTLISQPIDLGGGGDSPRLAWLEQVDVERDDDVDQLRVEVFDVEDPARRATAHKNTGHTRGFVPRVLDLSPVAHRTVRIQLTFDSVDGRLDATTGWFVDDLRIVAPGLPTSSGGILVINEVLADPPAGVDPRAAEFIELVNSGTAPVELGGATIADALSVRATLPAGTVLAPGGALVVRGDTSTGLSLNNDGDAILIHAAGGQLLAEFHYGSEGGNDQSLTRATDGVASSPMVGHRTVSPQQSSPGLRHDGRPFGGS